MSQNICPYRHNKRKNVIKQVFKVIWQKAASPIADLPTLTDANWLVRYWRLTHLTFLEPTRVSPPNSISIGSGVFAWLTNVTNTNTLHTHTDHGTPICSNSAERMRRGLTKCYSQSLPCQKPRTSKEVLWLFYSRQLTTRELVTYTTHRPHQWLSPYNSV